jgi:hypothetical protein
MMIDDVAKSNKMIIVEGITQQSYFLIGCAINYR